jgi:hypothetical protein
MSPSDWFWLGWTGGMVFAALMLRRPARIDGSDG